MTPEQIEEADLASRKPFTWTYEKDEYPESKNSWEIAEKQYKTKFNVPKAPPPETEDKRVPYHFDAEEDDDVISTLDNAGVAENAVYNKWSQIGTKTTTTNGAKTDIGDGFKVTSKKGKLVGGTKYTVEGLGGKDNSK